MFWVGFWPGKAPVLCVYGTIVRCCCCGGERKLHISRLSCCSKLPVFGEKVGKVVEKVGSVVAAEARPAATEMGSRNQVQSHPTIRAGNSSDCNRYFFSC